LKNIQYISKFLFVAESSSFLGFKPRAIERESIRGGWTRNVVEKYPGKNKFAVFEISSNIIKAKFEFGNQEI
jgi:hypothetical protein